jgi:hypothetical protein
MIFFLSRIFHLYELYMTQYFEFLNSVLIKNLEIDSSLVKNFYFIFLNFNFDQLVLKNPVKPILTGSSGFYENQLVFKRFFNP